jgi:hypothetical protein
MKWRHCNLFIQRQSKTRKLEKGIVRYHTPLLRAVHLFKQSIRCTGTAWRNTFSNWRFPTGQDLKNKPHGFMVFHKNMPQSLILWMFLLLYLKITATSFSLLSAVELPKSQMWHYDRKKTDHVEISRPAIVSVYSSHFQNVHLLNRNTRRFLSKMRSKKMVN